MRARGLFVLPAILAGGCDYFAAPEQLRDPDVISIAMVLVAGEDQAHLLAGRPLAGRFDPPPKVTATLIGPGWRVAFTRGTDLEEGCGGGPTNWPMPMVCLNATLPEPIREEVTYRLGGRGPKGSFSGVTTVPAAPTIQAPVDTVWLPGPVSLIRIPIRYHVLPDVGTLRPQVLQTAADGTGSESKWKRVSPSELDADGREATVAWHFERNFQRASLHLLGMGQRYTYFWEFGRKRVRWPKAGLAGKGVYGYFDGSAKSRAIEIRLVDEG